MSRRSQASADPTLTNFAQGHAQQLSSALAEFIAPTVVVPSTLGKYKKFDDKNAFQYYDTARALGGGARRIEFEATDPSYDCQPQALEITIDDAERDAAGDQDPLMLDQSKVQTLISTTTISHERAVFTAVAAAVSATGGVGSWSDGTTNDPVAEIDSQIEAITTVTGMMPNAILFGLTAWRHFRKHTKVTARMPGADLIGITTGQAAAMFLNPNVDVRVGTLAYDTTKWGKTASKSLIVGADVYIFLRSASPTTYDPSAFKTFMGGRGGITAVRRYRDESARSDVLAVDWSRDIKNTSSIAAKRITVS